MLLLYVSLTVLMFVFLAGIWNTNSGLNLALRLLFTALAVWGSVILILKAGGVP